MNMADTHNIIRDIHIIGDTTQEKIVDSVRCPALAKHRITSVGISDAAWDYAMAGQKPVSHVIACFAGSGEVWVDGTWQTCNNGMCFLNPAGAPHAFRALPAGRWGFCWVKYREDGRGERTVDIPATILFPSDPHFLHSAVLGLYQETIGAADPAAIYFWVELIHLHSLRIVTKRYSDNRLWRTWETVDADPARAWNVDELTSFACMSGEHLRRLCQKSQGMSPMQYVAHLRMHRAAFLLRSSEMSVDSVATAVGYDNRFSFSLAFKRVLGVAPGAYRTQWRQ